MKENHLNTSLLIGFFVAYIPLMLLRFGVFMDTESGRYIYSLFMVSKFIITAFGIYFAILLSKTNEKIFLKLYLVGWIGMIVMTFLLHIVLSYGIANQNFDEFTFLLSNSVISFYIIFSTTLMVFSISYLWAAIKAKKILLIGNSTLIQSYLIGPISAIGMPILIIKGPEDIITIYSANNIVGIVKAWVSVKIAFNIIFYVVILLINIITLIENKNLIAVALTISIFIISTTATLSTDFDLVGFTLNFMSGILVAIVGHILFIGDKK